MNATWAQYQRIDRFSHGGDEHRNGRQRPKRFDDRDNETMQGAVVESNLLRPA